MNKIRITALLLSAAVVFGSCSAYAMTDSEALKRGIAYGWAEAEHSQDAKVTRAEFAKMILEFAAIDPVGGTESQFEDISDGDESLIYINTAVQMKYIQPYLNNCFDPTGVITRQQAAKAVLTVLGYAPLAESSGGYPRGYIKTATGTDMFDGVKKDWSEALTYGEVVRILANSATIPLCEPVYEGGYMTYKVNEDKTILTENHDASMVKGVIVANDVTSITGSYASKDNIIVQTADGDIQINDGGKDVSNYLGYNATVYYREINDDNVLAYIEPQSSTNELSFENSDVTSFSNGSYSYYEGNRKKTVRVANDAEVIYNGRRVTDMSLFADASQMFFPRDDKDIPKDGTIKLVATDGGSSYNVVFVNVMECSVADHYSESNEEIFLKEKKGTFKIDDEDYFDLYDIDGVEMSPTDIKEWDVIEAYKAADGKYTKYVVVRNTVEGEVTSIRQPVKENDGEICIDGQRYPYNKVDSDIRVGVSGVFLLSSTDRVIAMSEDGIQHNEVYGYLVKAYHEDYEDMGRAEILTMDGNVQTYEFAQTVKVDGINYKKQEGMPLNNRQIITYKLVNDKIKTIDTVKKTQSESESSLRVIYSNQLDGSATPNEKSGGLLYKKNLSCFGGRIMVDADTKFITVPDSTTGFDKYSVTGISNLKNDKAYKNVAAYTLTKTGIKADVVVQELEGGIDKEFEDDSAIAVVSKVLTGINPNGDEADYVQAYVNGTLQNIYGEGFDTLGKKEGDKFYPLSVGDIFRYNLDGDGIVSVIEPKYIQRYNPELELPTAFENNMYGTGRLLACLAYDRTGDFLGVTINKNLNSIDTSKGDVLYFAANGANVYVYEKNSKKVNVGTLDDIETYQNTGDNCSLLYVSAFKGEILDVVVIKD